MTLKKGVVVTFDQVKLIKGGGSFVGKLSTLYY